MVTLHLTPKMDSKIITIFTIIAKITALTTQEVLSEPFLGANSTSYFERSEIVTKSPNSTKCVADSSNSTKCVSREKRQLPCCFTNPYPLVSLPCPYYNVNDGTCFMVSCPSGPPNCCDGVEQVSPPAGEVREHIPTPIAAAADAPKQTDDGTAPETSLGNESPPDPADIKPDSRNLIKIDCEHTICQPSHITICIKLHRDCDKKQNNSSQLDTTTPNTNEATNSTSNCCMTLIANCCKPKCCEPVIERNCSSDGCCSQIIFQTQPCCGKNASNANGSGNNGACDVSVNNITAENGTIVVSSSGKNLLQTLCSLMTFQNCLLCNNFNVGHAHNASTAIGQNCPSTSTPPPTTKEVTAGGKVSREAPARYCYNCCKSKRIKKRRSRKGKFPSRPQPSHRP